MNADQLIDQAIAAGVEGRLDEAESILRRVIELEPGQYRAYTNLGVALQAQDRVEESIDVLTSAVHQFPNISATARRTLAQALMKLNRPVEAAEQCRAALRTVPDDAEIHGLLARALLLSGEFKRGWAEYEWRWKCESFRDPRLNFAQPRWNGAKPEGKSILLHHEQGFGDTIQFVRYASLLADRGAAVTVQCPAELVTLIKRMTLLDEVVPMGGAVRPFDAYAPLMSLPLLFNTTLKTIPAAVPYLNVDKILADAWRTRIANDGATLRVGISWAGRPEHLQDKQRSLPLRAFEPLGSIEGVVFYSLQKGPASAEASQPPAGIRLIDAGSKLIDFADSAALIQNLDLVISVDTAVVHLAGALGKPVWTLLPFAPDFRWMLDRTDSPWYPTMLLLRQRIRGDWSGPIGEAVQRLKALAASGNSASV